MLGPCFSLYSVTSSLPTSLSPSKTQVSAFTAAVPRMRHLRRARSTLSNELRGNLPFMSFSGRGGGEVCLDSLEMLPRNLGFENRHSLFAMLWGGGSSLRAGVGLSVARFQAGLPGARDHPSPNLEPLGQDAGWRPHVDDILCSFLFFPGSRPRRDKNICSLLRPQRTSGRS